MSGPAAARGAFLRGLGAGLLAVSQPLYALLAAQPDFFTARAADAGDIAAVGLLAALPALLWGTAAAAAALLGAGPAAEAVSAAAAAALLAAQAGAALPWPAWAAVATAAGAAAAWATRRETARAFLNWTALAALLFPLLFLTRAPWPAPQPPPLAPPAAAPAGARPSRVVFVVFDEFPLATLLDADGGIDAGWFPAFARLSREAAWYREARSVSNDTFKAVPALLTGTYPRPPKSPWHRDYPRSLFTLLAGTHRLRVTETHTALCPPGLCAPSRPAAPERWSGFADDMAVLFAHRALPRAWGAALPSVSHSWKGFRKAMPEFSWDALNAEAGESYVDRAGAFRRFGAAAAEPGEPGLHFLHAMLPHPPWVHLPSGALAFTPNEPIVLGDGGREDRWVEDPDVVAAAWQRHILQARFADRLLGELMDGMKKSGVWEGALLVVAADHGAAFRPGARRRAFTPETAGEVVPVPLFVKYPAGLAPGERGPQGRPASLVDVLPTLLEAQGLPLPEGLDGSSLRRPGRPPEFIAPDGARGPAAAGWAAARRESARRRGLLGDGRRPDALFRLGPAGAAVGRPAAGLKRSKSPPCAARLEQALNGPASYSRAYLSGRVACPEPAAGRRPVVAVVDGTVAASGVTGSFDGTTEAPLRLMLPEDALRPGSVPEIFLAQAAKGALELRRVAASGAGWRLEGGSLLRSDGRGFRIYAGVPGFRPPARALKDVVVVAGDGRNPFTGKPAEEIIVFGGSRFLYAGVPDRASGRFDFALPRELAAQGEPLRVYGLLGSEVWELLE